MQSQGSAKTFTLYLGGIKAERRTSQAALNEARNSSDGVCVVSLLGLVAAGPPDVELPPADEPALVCATAKELARVKAAANKYVVVRCIEFPPIEGRL
jgi:hypothetical protein